MAKATKTDLIKQLTEGIATLTTTRQWERWLRAQRAFHRYSFGNTLLILRQFPEATRVAGFRSWRQLGRFVRKGEQDIAILAPVTLRPEPQDNGDDELSPVAYRIAYVFDIRQTDGDPLPEIACQLGGDGPAGASVRLERWPQSSATAWRSPSFRTSATVTALMSCGASASATTWRPLTG
jgi:hypothetical protein